LPDKARIKLIGAGGVGGIVCRFGLMFACSLAQKQGTDVDWVIIDGDEFEEANRSRMFFSRHGFKATVMRDDLRNLVEDSRVTLTAVPKYIDEQNLPTLIQDDDIVLVCVDNNATRKLVSDYCDLELRRFALFSAGNDGIGESSSGRLVRGTYGNCQVFLRGRLTSPSLTQHHAEVANPTDKLPTEIHCTELIASQPQVLFANLAAASSLLNALFLYLSDSLHYSELAFDIAEGRMRPLEIPAPQASPQLAVQRFS
jgi:hypothetical protein